MTISSGIDTNRSIGRPVVIDAEILSKLEYAFMHSFSDEEACLYANISTATLYRYIEKNPEFGEKKDVLKKSPNMKAKLTWIRLIDDGDYRASKDWLERKSRKEFSLKGDSGEKTDNSIIIKWGN